MFLSEINIYPIKSLSGISVKNAKIEERGLMFDRRWMLINEKNEFLTQREFPMMAAIGVALDDKNLVISFKTDKKKIAFAPKTEETANVKIWRSTVRARIYEKETNQWFSDVLQTNCRLVLMPEESKRIVNPIYAVRKFQDKVSFADGYPFLLIGENSLSDLNGKLENPVPMNRFRPNLVISGTKPFAEDEWKKIKIGDSVFHVVKPCDRCVITTIDQRSGVKDGKEPLKTLNGFRNKNGKVLFGQYLIAENSGGILEVGDRLEIIETKN